MHLAIHLCSISCSSCVIWSSKYSWRVLYQNLFGRMCSLLHYLQLVTQVLKKFLCYLKLDNFSSVLLLFPLLTFFLSSFSSLPPFLPSPLSLSWILLLRSYKMVVISFCVVSLSSNVLNKTRRVYKTFTNLFSATRVPIFIK